MQEKSTSENGFFGLDKLQVTWDILISCVHSRHHKTRLESKSYAHLRHTKRGPSRTPK
jgi:hypothetical protein